MREIKFRAWHRKLKEWHYFVIPFDLFQTWFIHGGERHTPTGLDYENWCEYTGLKDKNGKEIYESDLFTAEARNVGQPIEVKWHDGAWYGYYVGKTFAFILNGYEMSEAEVIGNIYENLKEKP